MLKYIQLNKTKQKKKKKKKTTTEVIKAFYILPYPETVLHVQGLPPGTVPYPETLVSRYGTVTGDTSYCKSVIGVYFFKINIANLKLFCLF